MPITLAKNLNLNLCFSEIKRPSIPPMPDDHGRSFPSASAATLIPCKSFNSLCDQPAVNPTPKSKAHTSLEPNSDSDSDSEPDFATVVASQRFFFASPGSSNSIIESTPSFSTNHSDQSTSTNGSDHSLARSLTLKGSVAIPTFSPDPFTDFRRSMQEMAEARELLAVESDWEYLHELLMSYLALNPESLHKYIIGAFADLLVSLMSTEGGKGRPEVSNVGRRNIPRPGKHVSV